MEPPGALVSMIAPCGRSYSSTEGRSTGYGPGSSVGGRTPIAAKAAQDRAREHDARSLSHGRPRFRTEQPLSHPPVARAAAGKRNRARDPGPGEPTLPRAGLRRAFDSWPASRRLGRLAVQPCLSAPAAGSLGRQALRPPPAAERDLPAWHAASSLPPRPPARVRLRRCDLPETGAGRRSWAAPSKARRFTDPPGSSAARASRTLSQRARRKSEPRSLCPPPLRTCSFAAHGGRDPKLSRPSGPLDGTADLGLDRRPSERGLPRGL